MNSQTVSVITVNFNGAKHLRDCLSSLQAQTHQPLEIFVVDNGSTDDSQLICSEYGVNFIASGSNIGLGAAYNVGAELAQGEYIFFINNDMFFEPACISALVAGMERAGPSTFAADPLQFSWSRNEIIHYRCLLRQFDHPIEVFSNFFCLVPGLKRVYAKTDNDAPIPFASGGSMLVRKRLLDALSGFDSKFFLDWEDVDLCWRANRRGWYSVFVPTARLRHKWGGTSKNYQHKFSKMTIRMGTSQQYNMMRFTLKNYDSANVLVFLLSRILAVPLFLLRLKPEAALCTLLGLGKALVTLPDILHERRCLNNEAIVSNQQLFSMFRDDSEPYRLVWPVESGFDEFAAVS